MHHALKAGLEAMGVGFAVPESERLPQLNLISIPDGADDERVRAKLLTQFNLEIGAGLGALAGKVWRIGLMGNGANFQNIALCLSALESALAESSANINKGVALQAADSVISAK